MDGGAHRARDCFAGGRCGRRRVRAGAREMADTGLRVVLLDLTSNSAAARPMTDGLALPGITNLLSAEAQFSDGIHARPVYSDAHVIPAGTANPVQRHARH